MRSILQEIGRLEKAYELLNRLVVAAISYLDALETGDGLSGAAVNFRREVLIANGFLSKYGEQKMINQTSKVGMR